MLNQQHASTQRTRPQRFQSSSDGKSIDDDDFLYDASLKVSGDFGSDEVRKSYADFVCSKLNAEVRRTMGMNDAVRRVLKHHNLTEHGDGVVEADLIHAVLDCVALADDTPSPVASLTEQEIEALALTHEDFGFGLADSEGIQTHGFNPEGLEAFVRAIEAKLAALPTWDDVAIAVGGVHMSHLNHDVKEHWCREVLLYSPNNPGDCPEHRVTLYAKYAKTNANISKSSSLPKG
jgi:hypothetical protein